MEKTGAFLNYDTQRSPCLFVLLSCLERVIYLRNKPTLTEMKPVEKYLWYVKKRISHFLMIS